MTMRRKTCLTMVLVVMMLVANSVAFADEIMPLAGSDFSQVSVTLSDSGKASFYVVTVASASEIKITRCWLKKKNANNVWVYAAYVDPPETSASGICLITSKDYSSDLAACGAGTYCICFTVDADGKTTSTCSNSITYTP